MAIRYDENITLIRSDPSMQTVNRELKRRQRRRQRKRQKKKAKLPTLQEHRLRFLLITLLSMHDWTEPSFTSVLWRTWTQDNNFLFPFSERRYGPLEFNCTKTRQQPTKWDKSDNFNAAPLFTFQVTIFQPSPLSLLSFLSRPGGSYGNLSWRCNFWIYVWNSLA